MKKVILVICMLFMCYPFGVQASEICDHIWIDDNNYYDDITDCTKDTIIHSHCFLCDEQKTEVIKGTEHQWGAWETLYLPDCMSTGLKVRYCDKCDKCEEIIIPKLDHTYGRWQEEEAATAFYNGLIVRDCIYCNHEQAKVTPKLKTINIKNKNEKEISKYVMKFFSYAKKYDIKKMRSCFSCQSIMFSNKKYMAAYVRNSNKKYLKYAIKSISINKKKGTAVVKVYCQYQDSYSAYVDAMDDVVKYLNRHLKASHKTIDKYQYKRTAYYNKKYWPTIENKTITLKMKKIKSKWKITSYTKSLNNAIHCDYQRAYDDYF